MYAAKAAQAAAVSPGGSPGRNTFCVKYLFALKKSKIQALLSSSIPGPMMSPGSQWGGSSYSGEGPYGGFQCNLHSKLHRNGLSHKIAQKQGEIFANFAQSKKNQDIQWQSMYCHNNIALTTKSSMYMYYTSLLPTPCYQILQLPSPHPTLKNQK